MTPDLAIARLTHEHRIILKVVDGLRGAAARLRDGAPVDVSGLRQAAIFLSEYADRLHHAKEEDLLFPALIAHGVPQHGCPIDKGSSENLEADFCTGYVLGALDQLSALGKICPAGPSMSGRALAVARKYIAENPEKWGMHPLVLVQDALDRSFPCSEPAGR